MPDPVAATVTGAESTSTASTIKADASPRDRLKAILSQSAAAPEGPEKVKDSAEGERSAERDPMQVDPKTSKDVEAEEPAADDEVELQEADGEDEQVKAKPTTLSELAESLGVDVEDILGVDIPTKIDGKEGTARLRDMLKSYQLEGHLNQKSMAFADEKKAFELETQRRAGEHQQRVQQMDAALQVGQRLLDGEFANVNWDELQATDRLEFNQKVVEYQQRQQALTHLAGIIGQERQQAEAKRAQEFATYKAEQMTLLQSKLPEWNDAAKRTKDIEEMSIAIKDAYGITPDELKSETDHRLILVARDAWKWQQLQKQKPTTINKVRLAPKLLKPGTTQSRAAQDDLALKSARDNLSRTGKGAASVFKRLGIA